MLKFAVLLTNSLSSLKSQFSDLSSMMPSLMEKGKPVIYSASFIEVYRFFPTQSVAHYVLIRLIPLFCTPLC